jgi:hypothetical protein
MMSCSKAIRLTQCDWQFRQKKLENNSAIPNINTAKCSGKERKKFHLSQYDLRSPLRSIVIAAGMITLTVLPSGCSIVGDNTLSSETAQSTVSEYVAEHNGSVSSVQGVIQNEGSSQAVATVEVNNFKYKTYGSEQIYTGPAIAEFSRYTDGNWSMTRFTVSPNNIFSSASIATNIKSPSSNNIFGKFFNCMSYIKNEDGTYNTSIIGFLIIMSATISAPFIWLYLSGIKTNQA